jgi:MoaA/NifB/PqqE/SkfB family radical SAM enzyme
MNLLKQLRNIRYVLKRPLIVLRIIKYLALHLLGYPTIRSLQIDLGYDCQLNCKHCYSAYMKDLKRSELDFFKWKDLINQAISMGILHVCFCGGEPLLYKKKLLKTIKYLNKKNIFSAIVTNGQSFSESYALQLKKAGLDMIFFSIDSHIEAEHDSNRNKKGCYVRTIEAIKTAKKNGFIVAVNTYISPERLNSKFIDRIIQTNKQLGVISHFNLLVSMGKMSKKNITYSPEQLSLFKKYGISNCNDRNCNTRGCPAGKEKILISAYGDVLPCALIQVSYGNVNNESLKKIYLRVFRSKLLSSSHLCIPATSIQFKNRYLKLINESNKVPISNKIFNSKK